MSSTVETIQLHFKFGLQIVCCDQFIIMCRAPNQSFGFRGLNSTAIAMDKFVTVTKYMCMFGSTYLCECTFSSLVRRKNKYRNSLSQENLESELRCELSEVKPDFVKMAKSKECHPSH